jgi:hypothetical protein
VGREQKRFARLAGIAGNVSSVTPFFTPFSVTPFSFHFPPTALHIPVGYSGCPGVNSHG